MTEYPKWFVPNIPYERYHTKPDKPAKKIIQFEKVENIDLNTYGYTDFIPPQADAISAEVNDGRYDDVIVTIKFLKKKEVDNPHYEKDYTYYQKCLKEYNNKIEESQKLQKIYDAESRKKLYEELKQEFEQGNNTSQP